MAKSITRWNNSSGPLLVNAFDTAIQPYVAAGDTDGVATTIYGPTETIPENQYEVQRTWTTTELAQNWLDTVVAPTAAQVGATELYQAVIA